MTDLFTNFDVKYAEAPPVMCTYILKQQVESIAGAWLGASASPLTRGWPDQISSPAHNSKGEILYSLEFVQIRLGGVAPNRGAIK